MTAEGTVEQPVLQGGALVLGQFSVLCQVRLVGVRLKPWEAGTREILLDGCELHECDLRLMSWRHFRHCFVSGSGRSLPNFPPMVGAANSLPLDGEITDATGCRIEVAPDDWTNIA